MSEPTQPSEMNTEQAGSENSARSLAERVTRLERNLKVAAFVISVIALMAPVASATAAWFSWRTASASELLARETVAKSGAKLTMSKIIGLKGHCGDTANPLTAVAQVENSGLIAGRVSGALLMIEVAPDQLPNMPAIVKISLQQQNALVESGIYWVQMASGHTVAVVNPQDSVDVNLLMDCAKFSVLGIDPSQALEQISASINSRELKWSLRPFFTFGGSADDLPIEGVYYQP